MLLTTVKINGNVNWQESSIRRDYRNFNREEFSMDLLSQRWTEVYNLHDPNMVLDKIMELWLEILNKHAPLRVITNGFGKNRLNLSKECRKLIKIRNKAKEVSKRSGEEEDWNQYKKLRNKVNDQIKKEREGGEDEAWKKISEDKTGKSLWEEVKRRAGWVKSLTPKILSIDGVSYTKPQDLANHLNDYFVQKIEKIKQNLGAPTQDPLLTLKAAMGKWQKCGTISSFDFKPIDVKVVQKIMRKMNKSSAECSNGLSNNVVKISPNEALNQQNNCNADLP